jgi:hypothetical protein
VLRGVSLGKRTNSWVPQAFRSSSATLRARSYRRDLGLIWSLAAVITGSGIPDDESGDDVDGQPRKVLYVYTCLDLPRCCVRNKRRHTNLSVTRAQ